MLTSFLRPSLEESLSLDSPTDATVHLGGRIYQYYLGTGYFGLQAHPEVLAATCEAVLQYGIGTCTTRATFTSPPVFEVQRKISQILGTELAFYFASEYQANAMILEQLAGTYDRVFIDEASHSSLFDSVKTLQQMPKSPISFAHLSCDDLESKLEEHLQPGERPLLLTDGVFSVHGRIAPLDHYDRVLSAFEGATVLVDDAHGFGILGSEGRGTLEHFDYSPTRANRTPQEVELLEMSTSFRGTRQPLHKRAIPQNSPVQYFFTSSLSKAIGGYGAIIPGSEQFVQQLIERSPAFYGVAPPPNPIAAATCKGLELVFERSEIVNRLRRNTHYLKRRLRHLGFVPEDSTVPVVALQLGSARNMKRIQQELSRHNILIAYLPRSPGIGSEGVLRIAVFATHHKEMLDQLMDRLQQIV